MTTTTLSEQLKVATRQIHTAAERAPFMHALLTGELPLSAYRDLLLNLRAVYAALETTMQAHRRELGGLLDDFDRLARLAPLDRDLAALAAPTSAQDRGIRPATQAYVARIEELARSQPKLLAAHAYVRYMGDLSGGQILARIVGQKLGAPIAFYEFAAPAAELKHAFRDALDALPMHEREMASMTAEAASAFERHVALFAELAA